MVTNVTIICAAEARSAVAGVEGLENQLTAAMKATYRHWLQTSEPEQFRAALAAVIEVSDEETHNRIMFELDVLNKLSTGDISAIDIPEGFEAIGLLKHWDAVKAEVNGG